MVVSEVNQLKNMNTLKAGDKAPDFTATIETGESISLKDYRGNKVVVYFYPRDNTPTCTVEACNIRDGYSELKGHNIEVFGVSPDSEKKHVNFISKFDLPFHLIADTEKELANAFGVWGPKKFMGKVSDGIHRTTFIIDEKGVIEQVISKVKSKIHTQQILEALGLERV